MPECPEEAVVPDRLCDRDQWVCWRTRHRDGKATKVPIDPTDGGFASATDPETWSSLDVALSYATSTASAGLGFVFTEDDPLVGVDLDDCRDPESGDVDADAGDILDRLDSYTEVSPSGTGFHVLVAGELPDGRNRRGSIECYDRARFFTVTGDVLAEYPERIAERRDALAAIHREYVAEDPASSTSTDDDADSRGDGDVRGGTSASTAASALSDEELLERARSAANGRKFRRLWNGQTSGYDSHSEADMALCCMLAFWTGGDHDRIDRLFRQSGLVRPKWEEVHYADGATYGERTIERAVESTSEFYDPAGSEAKATSRADEDRGSDRGRSSQDDQSGRVDRPGSRDTPDGDVREPAHLAEQNDVLVERVRRLEAELDRRAERIEELELALQAIEDGTESQGDHRDGETDDERTTPVGRMLRWASELAD